MKVLWNTGSSKIRRMTLMTLINSFVKTTFCPPHDILFFHFHPLKKIIIISIIYDVISINSMLYILSISPRAINRAYFFLVSSKLFWCSLNIECNSNSQNILPLSDVTMLLLIYCGFRIYMLIHNKVKNHWWAEL